MLVWAKLGSSAGQIAELAGWSTAALHVLHSRWFKDGDAIFDERARGARHHQHLNSEQEQLLLAPFVEPAEAGGIHDVAAIQQAYRERLGTTVAPASVHPLPDRHGWRKVLPHPRHSTADLAAQAAFKKSRALPYVERSRARLNTGAGCA